MLSVLLLYTDSDYPFGIFCHCVVCSSSIYRFWLPLWYLLSLCCLFFFYIQILITPLVSLVSFVIVLSVLLLYTDSDYPFGIFCHCVVCSSSIYRFWLPLWYLLSLCCLFFFYIQILITPLVSFVIVLSVLLLYTDSDYPFGIFCHCVVCSSIYRFWLPLWLSFVIVLSVLLLYTDSDYPFGIFCHCVVCSSIYRFWLPLWYLLSLCCLFFYIQILITPLVSFVIVLSVLLYTDSDYPFGIFCHCVVCSSSIYRFWLPLWYLLSLCCLFFFYIQILITPLVSFVIVLSVLLLYTDSDYPFGIFCHCVVCSSIYRFWLPLWYLLSLYCLFFFYIQILITPLVSFVIVLSVLLLYTDSDYPFGIFCHCVVCSSSIYRFWLPLWYLLSLCCLFFFYIQILITPLVSFVIVLSVLLLYTDSDYPFGIFCHCVVCSSSIYRFWLPLWYLLSLCCLFFYIQILITPLVSFVIVLFVLLLYTDSDYPFGIFCHCVVCSSIYRFWLPLWYLLSLCCLFFFYIQILITPLVSFVIVLSVLLYTDSDYPFGIFCHCVVCSSSIYRFWLPLWYLLSLCCLFFYIQILITPLVSFVIVLFVLLLYTDSDYPFGIFCHCVVCSSIYRFWLPLWYLLSLCCLFFYIQILITPLVSFVIVLSVLLLYTDSDYPFGIFCHCVVCSSSIYRFWLPLWYLLSLCCLFFFYIQILITPLVSFVIVLSVLLYTDSDYPFGIFCHCVVCSSSIYRFWLPLWYLLSLCCLFFFYIQILITPLVSFVIVLSVLLYTDSDYPFGIFCHCVVCSSSIYRFWLPLWYLLSLCCLFFFYIQILITPLVSFVIVLFVLLLYTDSDYPFGIFCHCVVFLLYTDSDYPFGIFCHCVVCSSSIYRFWLPLWYLLSLCCLFFFYIQILITPLVSFVIVLSVLLLYTDSDYPFGIFCHCVVCSSSIYRFWLPLWYLLSLCCLFFFYIQILITPLVSFVIVLSVLLLYTDSDYPFGIFCHCVVCSSSIYRFWLPLWYLLSLCCLFFYIQILITPLVSSFVIVLFVLLLYTDSDTDSDYPFGIFCHCVVCSSSDIQILITPLVSFVIVLFVLLLYTDSDYYHFHYN